MAYTGRPLPANALDPDGLERQFASQVHGPDAGYMIPFLLGARADRQARGETLAAGNAQNNEIARVLAERELAQQDAASRRTLAGTLAGHGVPLSDPATTNGMSPGAVSLGNNMIVGSANAQNNQRLAASANSYSEAGASPAALNASGMFPMTMGTSRAERVAAIGASGHGGLQYTQGVNPDGTPGPIQVRGRDPGQVSAGVDQMQGVTPEMSTSFSRLQQNAQSRGWSVQRGRMVNGTMEVIIQTPQGQQRTYMDQAGREVARPGSNIPTQRQ